MNKRIYLNCILALVATFSLFAFGNPVLLAQELQTADEPPAEPTRYELTADSKRKSGVPKGFIHEHQLLESEIFPGTKRRYYVYVPKQYNPENPAALMVFMDGHAYLRQAGDFRATVVMDNLIESGEMPVTIGVFIDPGHKKDDLPAKPGWQPQPENRSVEYDTLSDDYVRFVLEEILPKVESDFKISDDPEMRATCGISSGGICAFTMAWERPDQFRKVISHVGSFVNIRGGDVYPGRIRKTDNKPLRIFLQDGSFDLDNEHGNWPLANQQMAKSLSYKNYDFMFVYGEGAHNGNHGGAILPETLRWVWRDWNEQH